MRYVGVDGCKNGWAAVWLDEKGPSIQFYHHIGQLWKDHSSARFILIDMPIGLVDEADEWNGRQCDQQARKLLGRKAASLFSAPSRSSLYEADYEHASRKNFSITGKKLSKQSYYLIPKIKEVDQFLSQTPVAQSKIRESHPELCFRALSGFQDLASKKTKIGQTERLHLLKRYEPMIDSDFPKAIAPMEDILDAFVLAVTAKLAQDISRLCSVCDKRHYDSKGILMDIVFFNPGT